MVKRYMKNVVRKRSPLLYSWLKTGNDALFVKGRNKLTFAIKSNAAALITEEMVAPLFVTEWGRRASWGVCGLFVILCLSTAIHAMVDWYEDSIITKVQVMAMPHNGVNDHLAELITQIPNEHLFGKLGGVDGESVPITSLQLHLIGVVKSEQESASHVIISEAGQPGKVYSVGDSLPSGITVNSITDDGVILENGGHMEKLPLQRSQLSFQGMPTPLLSERDE